MTDELAPEVDEFVNLTEKMLAAWEVLSKLGPKDLGILLGANFRDAFSPDDRVVFMSMLVSVTPIPERARVLAIVADRSSDEHLDELVRTVNCTSGRLTMFLTRKQ
jgi:hypothetical protein